MRNSMIVMMALALLFGAALTAEAVLIDRGGGMIYSTDMNVTWLQDARYAGSTMTWEQARDWTAGLTYGGFTDWRLPTFDESNPSYTDDSLLHEMGYLYGVEGVSAFDPGPFLNMPTDTFRAGPWFWTGTLNSDDPTQAWRFSFGCG